MRFSLVFIAGIVIVGAFIGNYAYYFKIQTIFKKKVLHSNASVHVFIVEILKDRFLKTFNHFF